MKSRNLGIVREHLLSRNIRIEEDLVDQLFNSSENAWLEFSCCWRIGKESRIERSIPESTRKLAQVVHDAVTGGHFMNKVPDGWALSIIRETVPLT